jgi:hypothetical protein
MKPRHVRLDRTTTLARFTATRMPRLEFRQALFRTPRPGWQRRLYPAALVVTTTATDDAGRVVGRDVQAMRFALLYDHTWPEALFLNIRRWPYRPLDVPGAVSWTVEMRLRDLRLAEDEWVEAVFLG